MLRNPRPHTDNTSPTRNRQPLSIQGALTKAHHSARMVNEAHRPKRIVVRGYRGTASEQRSEPASHPMRPTHVAQG